MSVALSSDTMLTAIALTDVPSAVVVAIVVSGVPIAVVARLMAGVFDHNRVCEVLGLFVLLLVGIMLTSRTGHPVLFGAEVDCMSRDILYFVPLTAMLTDVAHRHRLRKIRTRVTTRSAGHVSAA